MRAVAGVDGIGVILCWSVELVCVCFVESGVCLGLWRADLLLWPCSCSWN